MRLIFVLLLKRAKEDLISLAENAETAMHQILFA
jgi:hypothetical protein